MTTGDAPRLSLARDPAVWGRTPVGLRASIDSLLRHQDTGGGFIASPDFSQYGYCWLRDASFVAYALDLVGAHDASARYHGWVARTIEQNAAVLDGAVDRQQAGSPPPPEQMPPARFALDGSIVSDDWPNFQIDGYGTWLWSLADHCRIGTNGGLSGPLAAAAERVARYLNMFALSPCFDVWEESGSAVHTSTLACAYGGLTASAAMLGDDALQTRAEEVRALVRDRGAREGYYRKSSESAAVDASALWLARPFGLVETADPAFTATVAAIERELTLEGGLRRYAADTYYGGGAWPVLTASLGWHHCAAGDLASARRCRDWVAGRRDEEGQLPEQVGGKRRDPEHFAAWCERWGPPARELLWSQAMYVVVSDAIEASEGSAAARSAGDNKSTTTEGEGA